MKALPRVTCWLFASLVMATSAWLRADERQRPAGRPLSQRSIVTWPAEWGVDEPTLYRVSAMGFAPLSSTQQYESVNGGKRCLGSTCSFGSALPLPSGVLITAITLEACDSDTTSVVTLSLYECEGGASPACTLVGSADTGIPYELGCGYYGGDPLPSPVTVENNAMTYWLEAQSNGANVEFRSATVWYQRQVSPAPLVATFNDVPTSHPQFRFIEALSQSGITAGCGAGSFCPDATVTRAQLAVFLAKALGLHWPF